MKRAERQEEERLEPEKEARMVRWARLFDTYATQVQRVQLDRLDREDRYVYMRDIVLSELEKLATQSRGQLLARILSFLSEREVRAICGLSSIIYEVCQRYKLKERFLAGVAFLGGARINAPRPVVSVGVSPLFFIIVTDDGNAYGTSYGFPEILPLGNLTRIAPVGDPYEQVICGYRHCLFITRLRRRAFGFLENRFGQLGIGAVPPIANIPTQVLVDERIKKVSCGWKHSAVLTETGNLYLFGDSVRFELGDHNPNPHTVPFPRLLDFPEGTLDVSLYDRCTIVLTGAREIRKYGTADDGDVQWIDGAGEIDAIYCGRDTIFYKDRAGNVFDWVNQRKLVAKNVKRFQVHNNWLTMDGDLYRDGRKMNTPLPVATFDRDAYVLSGENLPSINVQCVQCNQPATHIAADTYEAYCDQLICLPKRLRDDETDEGGGSFSRSRRDDPNALHATTQAILDNPRRMEAFANQLSREEIVVISKSEGNDFYSQLNRNNAFWYLISKRFIGVGFNRLVNYKDIAGRIL